VFEAELKERTRIKGVKVPARIVKLTMGREDRARWQGYRLKRELICFSSQRVDGLFEEMATRAS